MEKSVKGEWSYLWEEMISVKRKRTTEKRKDVTRKVVMSLIFIIGLSIFLYPAISNFINSRAQSAIINDYSEQVERLKEEDKERLRKEALEYNESIRTGAEILDPFAENRAQDTGVSYMDMLNIGEVMGYLEIQEIDVYLPIYHGTSDDVLNNGLGHIEQTSLPIGGAGTNSVLTGHRGLPEAKMFRNLDKVDIGDVFYVHSLDEVLAYKVFDKVVVPPTDIERLKIEEGKDIVTLITCDPYMINTNRLLVRGERTEYIPPAEYAEGELEPPGEVVETPSAAVSEAPLAESEHPEGNDIEPIFIGGTIVLAGGIILTAYFFGRNRKRR